MKMELSLMDRCLKRTRNFSGVPYTQRTLAERSARDIALYGPGALTSLLLKGKKGYGHKKQRRLIPSGPLGKVHSESSGFLHIEFPSVALLKALDQRNDVFRAIADYFTMYAEPAYPSHMKHDMAAQFAHANISVELAAEVIEALCQRVPTSPFGNSRMLIFYLLEIEHTALKHRWKRLDLAKWRTAGLTWPLVDRPATTRKPSTPAPGGVVFRVSVRHAKLLRLFDQAGESAKQHIEQTASFAAVRFNFMRDPQQSLPL